MFDPAKPAIANHFRVHLYAVIARILAHLSRPNQAEGDATWLEAYPFLDGYRESLAVHQPAGLSPDEAVLWWDAQVARWPTAAGVHLPLQALVEEAALTMDDLRLLLAVGLVEEDIRFGALFAALQEPLTARRPCVGLLGWLLATPGDDPHDAWRTAQHLLDLGYLLAENRADPRSEWVLRIPIPFWDALQGHVVETPVPGLTLQAQSEFPEPHRLILPTRLLQQIEEVPALLAHGQLTAIVVRGMSWRRTTLGDWEHRPHVGTRCPALGRKEAR